MELAVSGGSAIEVSNATFGRDFSEALVHQVVTAYLAGGRQEPRRKKHVRKLEVVAKGPGGKKVQGGRVPAPFVAHCGAVVAGHLPHAHRTTHKK